MRTAKTFGGCAHSDTRPVILVRLRIAGPSIREMVAILDLLDVDRSHDAVWNWVYMLSETMSDPPMGQSSRVAVYKKRIEIDGKITGCTPLLTPN